jgi:2Fe-2S ferredoxin
MGQWVNGSIRQLDGAMAEIIFVEHDGTEHRVSAERGRSVMQVALEEGIPGVLADCGGNCSCGTCRAYIGEDWHLRLEPASPDEELMLGLVAAPGERCRLTCQIPVTDDLDGIIVCWPESQL